MLFYFSNSSGKSKVFDHAKLNVKSIWPPKPEYLYLWNYDRQIDFLRASLGFLTTAITLKVCTKIFYNNPHGVGISGFSDYFLLSVIDAVAWEHF